MVVAALEEKEGMDVQVAKVVAWCRRQGRRVVVGCKGAFCSRLQRLLADRGIRALDKHAHTGFWALTLSARRVE
jgi:hypothetical protein